MCQSQVWGRFPLRQRQHANHQEAAAAHWEHRVKEVMAEGGGRRLASGECKCVRLIGRSRATGVWQRRGLHQSSTSFVYFAYLHANNSITVTLEHDCDYSGCHVNMSAVTLKDSISRWERGHINYFLLLLYAYWNTWQKMAVAPGNKKCSWVISEGSHETLILSFSLEDFPYTNRNFNQ